MEDSKLGVQDVWFEGLYSYFLTLFHQHESESISLACRSSLRRYWVMDWNQGEKARRMRENFGKFEVGIG